MLYVQAALGRSLPCRPIVRILTSPFQGLQRTFSNEEVFEAENELKTSGNSNRLWIHNESLLCKQLGVGTCKSGCSLGEDNNNNTWN